MLWWSLTWATGVLKVLLHVGLLGYKGPSASVVSHDHHGHFVAVTLADGLTASRIHKTNPAPISSLFKVLFPKMFPRNMPMAVKESVCVHQ